MKQVKNTLTCLFWSALALAVVIAVVYETGMLESGALAGLSANGEFIVTTMMELLTLASVPLALKLFRFKKVHNDLMTRKADALRSWGLLRLGLLTVLLIANTLLYYIYAFEAAFGYLAVMVLLSMPFILPTMSRCQSEIEEE